MGGKPPCRGVSVPEREIELYVAEILGSSTLAADAGTEDLKQQLREFSAAWSRLDELAQCKLLPEILQEVVLDPHAGTIIVALRPDALDRLRERISP